MSRVPDHGAVSTMISQTWPSSACAKLAAGIEAVRAWLLDVNWYGVHCGRQPLWGWTRCGFSSLEGSRPLTREPMTFGNSATLWERPWRPTGTYFLTERVRN